MSNLWGKNIIFLVNIRNIFPKLNLFFFSSRKSHDKFWREKSHDKCKFWREKKQRRVISHYCLKITMKTACAEMTLKDHIASSCDKCPSLLVFLVLSHDYNTYFTRRTNNLRVAPELCETGKASWFLPVNPKRQECSSVRRSDSYITLKYPPTENILWLICNMKLKMIN